MSSELMVQFENELIRASAGTGKTFALSNRYLQLLASGADCDTILATTFTRKGAGEILDRIIERLADAAISEDKAEKLSAEIGYQLPRQRAAVILHELLGNLHRLEISTLDSFFNRVAKAFSLELGLPPTWDIVSQQQSDQLHDQSIQAILREDTVEDLLHLMNKGEVQRRVADLVRTTVNAVYEIFLEAQDAEIWNRIPELGKWLDDATLDQIRFRVEGAPNDKRKNPQKDWDKIKEDFANGNWESILVSKTAQGVANGTYKYGKSNSKLNPKFVAIMEDLLPHCLNSFTRRLILQNRSTHQLLKNFSNVLEQSKDETGQLRFSDITNRLHSFVEFWTTDQFNFRLDHQIQHLLLDEFQDTSPGQWNIVRPFAKAVTESDSLRSFFCVGDMKQAIYGWRGGVAEIFDLVDEELKNIDSSRRLTASYRSSKTVIDFVNSVFGNLNKFHSEDEDADSAVHRWSQWFEDHTTEKHELQGYATVEYAPDCDEALRRLPGNQRYRVIDDRNQKLTECAVDRIEQLTKTIPETCSIGVLVRTNEEVGELIFSLQQRGIQASEEGGNALTDSASVELVLSALYLADHPGDDISRFHVSHSPLGTLFGLQPENSETSSENRASVASGAAKIRDQLVRDGYGPTIEFLARTLAENCTQRELLRLQHLVRVAYSAASDNDRWSLRPESFVKYIRDEVKITDQNNAQVRVMTIHQSKGLEFDVVVLPLKFKNNGWFHFPPSVIVGREHPTAPIDLACRYVGEEFRNVLPKDIQAVFAANRQAKVRDEMCNLYVALTRAVHSTHVLLSFNSKTEKKKRSGLYKSEKSFAGILLSALEITERKEGVVWESGNENWYEGPLKSAGETLGEKFSKFYLPEETSLSPAQVSRTPKSKRGVRFSSPSHLEGGDQIKLSTVFGTLDNEEAMTRGTMIHACFEQVNWLDEHRPTQKELAKALKAVDPTRSDYQSFVEQFEIMIKRESLEHLLTHQHYLEDFVPEFTDPGEIMLEAHRLEVHNERAFAVEQDGELLSGFIDRLVMVYEGDELVGADIIDFKSDPVDDSSLGNKINHYRPQMEGYRRAVAAFTGLPANRICARLAFVETGKVVIVHNSSTTESPAKDKPKPKSEKPKKKKVIQKKKAVVKKEIESAAPKKKGPPKPKRNSDAKRQRTLWDE